MILSPSTGKNGPDELITGHKRTTEKHANSIHASTATAVEVISTRTLGTFLRRLYDGRLCGLGPADQEVSGGVRRGASPT